MSEEGFFVFVPRARKSPDEGGRGTSLRMTPCKFRFNDVHSISR
jgi:hypothetical protein